MLISAIISPHPPIIIPEVGGGESKKAKKTIKALKKLNKEFKKLKPETLIVISPHGLVYPDQFNVCAMPFSEGNFAHFGAFENKKKFQNDLEMALKIDKKAQKQNIPVLPYNNDNEVYELDHGTLVPLYWLAKDIKAKILPIAYSYLSKALHYSFGQLLSQVVDETNKKVAVIASGDLSHRLKYSQYGYSEAGEEFDRRIIENLKKGDTNGILSLDENLIEEAGECGYRSIIILLGILDQKKWQAEILSYEAPFGIGYLTSKIVF